MRSHHFSNNMQHNNIVFRLLTGTDDESGNGELGQLLDRVLNQDGVLDLTQLCIVPRKHCWLLYLDVVVDAYMMHPFSLISIAMIILS